MAMEIDKSVSLLEGKLKARPDSLVFSRLADSYRKSGNVQKAISLCIEGLKSHPYYITGHIILGRCYLEQENFSDAIKEFSKTCLFDRRNQVGIKMLADIFSKQGMEDKAGDLYNILLKMDPDNSSLAHLSNIYSGNGKTDLLEILGIENDVYPEPLEEPDDSLIEENSVAEQNIPANVSDEFGEKDEPEEEEKNYDASLSEILSTETKEDDQAVDLGEVLDEPELEENIVSDKKVDETEEHIQEQEKAGKDDIESKEVNNDFLFDKVGMQETVEMESPSDTDKETGTIDVVKDEETVPDNSIDQVDIEDISDRMETVFSEESEKVVEEHPETPTVEIDTTKKETDIQSTSVQDLEVLEEIEPDDVSLRITEMFEEKEDSEKEVIDIVKSEEIETDEKKLSVIDKEKVAQEEYEKKPDMSDDVSDKEEIDVGEKEAGFTDMAETKVTEISISKKESEEKSDGDIITDATAVFSRDMIKNIALSEEESSTLIPDFDTKEKDDIQSSPTGAEISSRLDEIFTQEEDVVKDSVNKKIDLQEDKPETVEVSKNEKIDIDDKEEPSMEDEEPFPDDLAVEDVLMDLDSLPEEDYSETQPKDKEEFYNVSGDNILFKEGELDLNIPPETIDTVNDDLVLEEMDPESFSEDKDVVDFGKSDNEEKEISDREDFSKESKSDDIPSDEETSFDEYSFSVEDTKEETSLEHENISDKVESIPDHVLTPTLADIYFQQGQANLAVQIYRRLLERDPDNEKIENRIAEIEKTIKLQEEEESRNKLKGDIDKIRRSDGMDTGDNTSKPLKTRQKKEKRPLKGIRIKKNVKERIKKRKGIGRKK